MEKEAAGNLWGRHRRGEKYTEKTSRESTAASYSIIQSSEPPAAGQNDHRAVTGNNYQSVHKSKRHWSPKDQSEGLAGHQRCPVQIPEESHLNSSAKPVQEKSFSNLS